MEIEGADIITMEQFQFGQCDEEGSPIEKPTKWLSNSPHILRKLSKRCTGRLGWCSRNVRDERHVLASGRMARDAAIYPFQLCKATLQGLRDELAERGHYSKSLGVMAPLGYGPASGRPTTTQPAVCCRSLCSSSRSTKGYPPQWTWFQVKFSEGIWWKSLARRK